MEGRTQTDIIAGGAGAKGLTAKAQRKAAKIAEKSSGRRVIPTGAKAPTSYVVVYAALKRRSSTVVPQDYLFEKRFRPHVSQKRRDMGHPRPGIRSTPASNVTWFFSLFLLSPSVFLT